MSHTPGPWKNDGVDVFRSDEGPVWVIEDEAETNICLAFVFASGVNLQVSEDEAAANANLIAAAPDLLVALKDMVKATDNWNASVQDIIGRQPHTGIDLENARAAIAKARGES